MFMTTPVKDLQVEAKKRQALADKEAAELAAWKPPTATWEERMRTDSRFRTNPIARINSFNSDNLIEFHEYAHTHNCECMQLTVNK